MLPGVHYPNNDENTRLASAKGKGKEDVHWQLGWWELSPILDRTHKPVAWSRSSVIFSGHPTKPHVLAHHHNSSKEFTLNTPPGIEKDPDSYSPPSIISVSPKEDYLFAYFPGIKDNIGCVWRRGIQLDAWTIQDEWRYIHGTGIVACEWSASNRDWIINDAGNAARMPPLGLQLPISDPILLLVTQSREFHVILFPPKLNLKAKVLRISLVQTTIINVPIDGLYKDPLLDNSVGGRRVCVAASIGLSYNDGSILVATRSRFLPPDDFGANPDDNMDIVLNLEQSLTNPLSTAHANSWDSWSEDSIIELCEVWLNKPGLPIIISSRPLPSILRAGGQLVDMKFFCTPPEPPGSTSPIATKDPRRQAKEQAEKRGHLYLVANFLNTSDYTAPPQSEVNVYTFGRIAAVSPKWSFQRESAKTFDKTVVAYLFPVPTRTGVFVGQLDTSGSYRRTKSRVAHVGNVSVLNLPDLTTDERWETVPILSPIDSAGRDLPTCYAISPNSLLLINSPSESRTLSHLPRRNHASLPPPTQGSNISMDLGRSLAASVFARKSSVDVIDVLTAKSTSEGVQETALAIAIALIEGNAGGLGDMWMHELLGVLTEVARTKLQRTKEPAEKAVLKAQWTTVHDMCSIAVINTAFADCREGDSYDLEAVWQLIALCVWVLDFLERVIRDCVSIGDNLTTSANDGSLPSKTDPASANLLHLVHRYALNNLYIVVNHVKGLRDELGNLTPKAENAHMAKEVLMDAFNCAGINIDALSQVLGELKDSPAVSAISASDLRQCLASFVPIANLRPNVTEILNKLLTSKAVDRPKLFIKSPDLIDDLSQISLSDSRKDKDKVGDVVTKGSLLRRGAVFTCIRCGGKFEIGESSVGGHSSLCWRAWERRWVYGCICGGLWTFSGNS
ncbi:hypothetical protein QCA50_003059 [Cerrena zonata]|uniref:Mediator complex subunit 16 C-terminal domain-containing protein n=1 Tax=Cerrena zonata TaxID=2478898 RepID=A0AAW0GLB2_9APHY